MPVVALTKNPSVSSTLTVDTRSMVVLKALILLWIIT